MKAIVLCAGRGLGDLAEHKPLAEVAGKPVLGHDLHWLAEHGVRDVAINLHDGAEAIADYAGDGTNFGLRVRYSREDELAGTAGALVPLAEFFADGPFLVLYGSRLFDFELDRLIEEHSENMAAATVALYSSGPQPDSVETRVEMDRSGRILRAVAARIEPDLEHAPAGCYVLEPSLIEHIEDGRPRSLWGDLFPLVMRNGILSGHPVELDGVRVVTGPGYGTSSGRSVRS